MTNLPPLFDTHAHMDEPSLAAETEQLLAASQENGLVGVLTIGTTVESSRGSIVLAEKHEGIYAAVGIHPNYVSQAGSSDWDTIVELAQHNSVKAIGETGLDRYWDHSPIETQVDYFKRHLQLTRETGKPFIVHCRDAEPDVLEVLEAEHLEHGPLNGVMHSFCGSAETAQKCLDWGMMISFSGMLTFKRNVELRELAASVPQDRVLVETDAPYLAPMPFRGKRNQPAYVKHTAEVLADCYGMSYKELCLITTANAMRFLKIK
ncbi:TatD family hydrolase [Rubinisphaera sp.]|uniref:TatD family hydrolase n=1 Tax=Rubinisphaera sp. TaxID=2024857 RepID=UPI000C0D33F0|nr:TatD family hydrolase [Rubinisphaera sp.]MBV09846.1 hydrolase TatD [Rubinisphaera sp.]HCS50822.1 hydrolase TatD [Planctomycetaceae bacterium]